MNSLDPLAQVIPLDFTFDIPSMIAGILFGFVGIWLYREGKKKTNNHIKFSGVALMIYPYFIEGALWNWMIGLLICGWAYYFWETEEIQD